MRWSTLFIPTLRDAPADAEAASHKLLVRGGFIRQLHAGHYSFLPLGWKVHEKVANIVRYHMNAIGGQEFLLPAMHPAWIWERSGRWETMGQEMFRLVDRKDADMALGMTHEEVFAYLATEIASYKSLPQIWYQIQTKFRDEPRPKSGLLRVREFAMKDSYSFDLTDAGLDESFDLHHGAYQAIFDDLSLPVMAVTASSGAMGGSDSVEFMTPSPAGEDDVAFCPECGYAANVERATARVEPIEDQAGPDAPERFATPGVRTIAALEAFDGGAPATSQIKTMVMMNGDTPLLALVRGDHQLNVQKLADAIGAVELRPASPEETQKYLGANPGSLGAVGVDPSIQILVDNALSGRTNMTTGANEDDWHYRGVSLERDVNVGEWVDLREVSAGEPCTECGTPLEIVRCIEVGHIFKLGRRYATAMETQVQDENGEAVTLTMGSYGIGIARNMAAVAEAHHDDKGLLWPVSIAPYEAVVTAVNIKDEASMNAAEKIYHDLLTSGIDVLFDDRDARPGVKFADAELIGIPYRITIGPKTLADGQAEFTHRATGETERFGIDDIVDHLVPLIRGSRRPRLT